ncbi:MAG TPA: NAD-dependent epimerase/dehydratase family protein, partial [Bacteroidetes bacterium]|nr:NAD-dependent epimerase/dehydratase family protein [Bacteroidota bacterium]
MLNCFILVKQKIKYKNSLNLFNRVNASSSSVYGDLEVLPKTEDMLPKPLSPYAVSKLAGEKYCQVFTQLYSIS